MAFSRPRCDSPDSVETEFALSAEDLDAIYLANQSNSPLLRLPAELRTVIFRHVCDTLTIRLRQTEALQDLVQEQPTGRQGVTRPGTPRPDTLLQLQGSKSGSALLSVCRQIKNEASDFMNDIHVTRVEGITLFTAESMPAQCRPIANNTVILQMPMLSFLALNNEFCGSSYCWYVGADVIKRRLWDEFPNVQTVEVYNDPWSYGAGQLYKSGEPDSEVVDRFKDRFRNKNLEVILPKPKRV